MRSEAPPAAAPTAQPLKGPRPAKANGFKQALARAQEGAGPDAPGMALPMVSMPGPWRVAVTRPAEAAPSATALGRDVFRDRIAAAEGSHQQYGVRNHASGALGRYQMLPQALRDLGWQDAQGHWTATAARHGVASTEQFLANPAAQEAAMTTYLAHTEVQLSRNGALAKAGGSVPGLNGQAVPVTEAGLMAAAHRRGAGSVARYLAHRVNTPDASLTPQQQRAFAAVERRLRDFAELPYATASRRGATAPSA